MQNQDLDSIFGQPIRFLDQKAFKVSQGTYVIPILMVALINKIETAIKVKGIYQKPGHVKSIKQAKVQKLRFLYSLVLIFNFFRFL